QFIPKAGTRQSVARRVTRGTATTRLATARDRPTPRVLPTPEGRAVSHYDRRVRAALEGEGMIAEVVSRKLQRALHGGDEEAPARRRRRCEPDRPRPDPEADLVLRRELILPP